MNKAFITYLSSKLKTGNLKTIHLNALPGRYATRLDLKKLDCLSIKPNTSSGPNNRFPVSGEFLFNYLLKKSDFEFKLNFESLSFTEIEQDERKGYDLLAKRLDALVNQDDDNFLEHGIRTFSIGYPLLIKRSKKDLNKIIKAPIFLWELEISRSNTLKNHWSIKKNKESAVYLNEVLISYLNSDEGISIEDIEPEITENVFSENDLKQSLTALLRKFNCEPEELRIKLNECIDVKEIERLTPSKPWISWSAVFGLYKTQKESIINDSDKLIDQFEDFDFSDLKIEQFRTSLNSSVLTDPSQDEIIASLEQKEYKIIQGPPGTGKSQSLTAIITNALENGGTVLVVCEKKTALDVIHKNLKTVGLEKLVAIVDDVISDRKRIIDTVRQIIQDVKYIYKGFHEEDYDSKVVDFKGMTDRANVRHHNLLTKVFKGYNTQMLIAEFLKLRRKLNFHNRLLDNIEFKFQASEFDTCISEIKEGSELFEEIRDDGFVYDKLDDSVFLNSYSIKHEIDVFNKIERLYAQMSSINFSELSIIDSHKLNEIHCSEIKKVFYLKEHTDCEAILLTFILNAKRTIADLKKIEALITQLNSLTVNNDFLVWVDNIFLLSNQINDNIQNVEYIYIQFNEIKRYYKAIDKQSGSIKFSPLTNFLKYFSKRKKQEFDFWYIYENSNIKINNAIRKTYFALMHDSYKLIRDNVLEQRVHGDMKDLETLIKQRFLFREYYLWRHFYIGRSDLVKICLNRLIGKVETPAWLSTFRMNYLNLVLENTETALKDFHTNNKLIESISSTQSEIMQLQKHKILKNWEDKQFHLINRYNKKSNVKWLFNYQKNSQYSKRNSLRAIIHEEFDLFTTIFPVLLVNPITCSSILPLRQGLFNIVIFDEASQLRLEDTFPALIRGKLKVISGDKHQMPPSNYFASDITLDILNEEELELTEAETEFEKTNPLYLAESESLLAFGNNLNPEITNTSFLDFHYRSRHPFLIDFSNAAFYGSRLIPMPTVQNYSPIIFVEVNGLYESNGTNPSEARAIVNFLTNNYHLTSSGEYPSLGIATFNLQQRNLIKDMINEEAVNNEQFREKLQMVGEQTEWFVKNLENIQGDERDIIIISTTFGKNADGRFTQSFGQINTYKGYRLLNVIITRAKKQVMVFTSIPSEYYSNSYKDEILTNGNRGKALLYAYLDYCKSVHHENENKRKEILDILRKGCAEQQNNYYNELIESPFEQEVYEHLLDYIKEDRIVPQYSLGGFKIDFVLLDKSSKAAIAIECDGAAFHSSEQAYSYDIHRQRILERYGLKFIRIWSKSWWPDPSKEIQKILKFIEDCEPSLLKKLA